MLENPSPAIPLDSSSAAAKRYPPPNQRNRSLTRRKSGDRSDRTTNIYGNDGEKFQHHSAPRNLPFGDHGDVGTSNLPSENTRARIISLEGCSRSEASQLLNDRWEAVMHNYNDPAVDLSERPVMYSGSAASSWGQFRLPHQLMSQQNNAGSSPQFDFLSELRRAIRSGGAYSDH